jgi:putative PIN family toxin of toxin-antitoxin system
VARCTAPRVGYGTRSIIELFTSAALLAELDDVLHRDKLAQRLERIDLAPRDLVLGYAALATLVQPAAIPPTILDDPDDDDVLACAVAAQAEVIVSGDGHLLNLKAYQGISIIKASEAASRESERFNSS